MNKHLAFLIAGITLSAAIILSANYMSTTGFAVSQNSQRSVVEKTITLDVWANTSIEVSSQGNLVSAKVYLDNGTEAQENRTEVLLDNSLINSYEGKPSLFDLSEISPGNHTLSVEFRGYPAHYIRPSSSEQTLEKTDSGIVIGDSNKNTQIGQSANETPQGCKTFEEPVLWSSGYSNNQSSVNYTSWRPSYNCSNIGSANCFIENIEPETRFIYYGDHGQQGIGYVQISDSGSVCLSPESGSYENYLAYETLKDQAKKKEFYSRENKTLAFSDCFGIKSYSDSQLIVDTLKVKYSLCAGGQNA